MDILSYVIGYKKSKDGGGAVEWVSASGEFTGDGKVMTIEHNLGVAPDFFAVWGGGINTGTKAPIRTMCAVGFSDTFKAEVNAPKHGFGVETDSYSCGYYTQNSPIEGTSGINPLNNATATTIVVGHSDAPMRADNKYFWMAFGRKA